MKSGFKQLEWANFVEQYYEGILSYAVQFLRNRAEAEDVTQDVFLRAQQHLMTGAKIHNERHWIYSIVRNICIDRSRWWKRWKLSAFDEGVMPHGGVQNGGDMELKHIIQHLVAKLPIRQREVFILRHWHGFSTEETAELLSLDAGTVKTHLSRSIAKLKAELGDAKL